MTILNKGDSFSMAGIEFTIIDTRVITKSEKRQRIFVCISNEILYNCEFNCDCVIDFRFSKIKSSFDSLLKRFRQDGVPDSVFHPMHLNLTADDGMNDIGYDHSVLFGLISAERYRSMRYDIPAVDDAWWTCTATSAVPGTAKCKLVNSDGVLVDEIACNESGVRPVCMINAKELLIYLESEKSRKNWIQEMNTIAAECDPGLERIC